MDQMKEDLTAVTKRLVSPEVLVTLASIEEYNDVFFTYISNMSFLEGTFDEFVGGTFEFEEYVKIPSPPIDFCLYLKWYKQNNLD